jgi:branched-chain amino acid transport system substrate-binding protein
MDILKTGLRRLGTAALMLTAAAVVSQGAAHAQSGEPIKIGFGMSLTGGLAPNGKSSLVAMKVWEDDINAKGGLLGRPVKLVYYDDQTNPSTVPGIYTKLMEVDKVDLVVSGYATNMIAPAMPVVMQKGKLFLTLFGTAVNEEFKYPKFFSMIPTGPTPKPAFTRPFFNVAMQQNPKPETVAIAAVDAEYGHNVCAGARENAKAAKLKIVYDRTYPPATTDYTPIVRAIAAAKPDLVVVCSYPPDTVGIIRAVNETGFKPKMLGGAMVGLQATVFKTQLGPLLNGIVNYDTWVPAKTMQFPGSMDLIKKYQDRAAAEGVDPLGYYMPVWAYAYLQVLEQAVQATKTLDDTKLADYIRGNKFKTVVGDVAFGPNGEWVEERMLAMQFQNIKGNDIGQFRDMSTYIVLDPPAYKSGDVIYPFEKARQ